MPNLNPMLRSRDLIDGKLKPRCGLGYALLISLLGMVAAPAQAGALRDWIQEHRAARQHESLQFDDDSLSRDITLPAHVRVLRDIAYGSDPAQRLDVYIPPKTAVNGAPVILMVHGGGWRRGDKADERVVQNKLARWAPKGFVFISTNYPMLPNTDPLKQAENVARALGFAQTHAKDWGADPTAFVLMGHSAGAHLVALLAADPDWTYRQGAKPWLGTVILDSAALDVPEIMQRDHFDLYDPAFGTDPAYWFRTSPMQQLKRGAGPMLAVCSSQRPDNPCDQVKQMQAKAQLLGVRLEALPEPLSHRHINEDLGTPGGYTDAVEKFMGSLPGLAGRF